MSAAFSPDAPEAVADRYGTHKVLNQAQPATGFNAFTGDAVLAAAIEREAPWAADRCEALGALAGDEHVQELARLANRHLPELKTHDRFGNRIDWVDFHPSWHELMSLAWQHEVPSLAWRTNQKNGHMPAQCCPTSGTRSSRGRLARRAWPMPPMPASRPNLRSPSGPRRQGNEYEFSRKGGRRQAVRRHRLCDDGEAGRLGSARNADHRALLAHRPTITGRRRIGTS